MFGDDEPRIEATPSVSKQHQTYHIDVALYNLVSHRKVSEYLAAMLTRVIKTAMMEKYGEIQKIVDEVMLSPETRELVKSAIKNEVERMTAQAVKEMFDGK